VRHIFITFCLYALTLLACKKDNANRSDIYGKWQWENSIGGFTGRDTIKPFSNSLVFLTFKHDMTYTTMLNGQVIFQGTFQILTVNSQRIIRLNNFVPAAGLMFENNGAMIQIDNNKLRLTDYQISEPYTHSFK
jgi:hypothetical protein